ATQSTTVATNSFDDQPPHLRYQAKANVIATIQATKAVRASQSIGRCTGCGGRSGQMNRQTRSAATMPTGTYAQYIHRHDSHTSRYALTRGVTWRVEYAKTP